ncbi:hypothetical protein C922_01841 [Plasmodium inui San Antonio 1]|uniref:Merozoite surface protein C-terminal domain-containing protein n=1 Tax=Plasmodium inui San Antonio 1 TaxID=1237626 RepID=W7AQD9_9APIC|nr:hypothetical protein C922_01841 [Plasmodium inui San Antonio 1]EUD67656.1 hypothetical protein C922_01841 [Plasmodium inui San Antonio 1]
MKKKIALFGSLFVLLSSSTVSSEKLGIQKKKKNLEEDDMHMLMKKLESLYKLSATNNSEDFNKEIEALKKQIDQQQQPGGDNEGESPGHLLESEAADDSGKETISGEDEEDSDSYDADFIGQGEKTITKGATGSVEKQEEDKNEEEEKKEEKEEEKKAEEEKKEEEEKEEEEEETDKEKEEEETDKEKEEEETDKEKEEEEEETDKEKEEEEEETDKEKEEEEETDKEKEEEEEETDKEHTSHQPDSEASPESAPESLKLGTPVLPSVITGHSTTTEGLSQTQSPATSANEGKNSEKLGNPPEARAESSPPDTTPGSSITPTTAPSPTGEVPSLPGAAPATQEAALSTQETPTQQAPSSAVAAPSGQSPPAPLTPPASTSSQTPPGSPPPVPSSRPASPGVIAPVVQCPNGCALEVKYLDKLYDELLKTTEGKDGIHVPLFHSKYNDFRKKYEHTMNEREYQIVKNLFEGFFKEGHSKCGCPVEFFKKLLNDAGLQKQFDNFMHGLYGFAKRHNYLRGERMTDRKLCEEVLKNVINLLNTIEIIGINLFFSSFICLFLLAQYPTWGADTPNGVPNLPNGQNNLLNSLKKKLDNLNEIMGDDVSEDSDEVNELEKHEEENVEVEQEEQQEEEEEEEEEDQDEEQKEGQKEDQEEDQDEDQEQQEEQHGDTLEYTLEDPKEGNEENENDPQKSTHLKKDADFMGKWSTVMANEEDEAKGQNSQEDAQRNSDTNTPPSKPVKGATEVVSTTEAATTLTNPKGTSGEVEQQRVQPSEVKPAGEQTGETENQTVVTPSGQSGTNTVDPQANPTPAAESQQEGPVTGGNQQGTSPPAGGPPQSPPAVSQGNKQPAVTSQTTSEVSPKPISAVTPPKTITNSDDVKIKYLDELYDEIMNISDRTNDINKQAYDSKYSTIKKKYKLSMNPVEYQIVKNLFNVGFKKEGETSVTTSLSEVFKKVLDDEKSQEQFDNFVEGLYGFAKRHSYLGKDGMDNTRYSDLLKNAISLMNTLEVN